MFTSVYAHPVHNSSRHLVCVCVHACAREHAQMHTRTHTQFPNVIRINAPPTLGATRSKITYDSTMWILMLSFSFFSSSFLLFSSFFLFTIRATPVTNESSKEIRRRNEDKAVIGIQFFGLSRALHVSSAFRKRKFSKRKERGGDKTRRVRLTGA